MNNELSKKILKRKTKKIIVIKQKPVSLLDSNLWESLSSFKNVDHQMDTEDDSETCQYCHKSDMIHNNDGLIVCKNCGATSDKIIDQSAEWRYYGYNDNKNSDPTRCGLPINNLLPQSSMTSVISNFGKNE